MPRFARVVKIEEKGSDVNLGAHLVRDAFAGAFQHAAVITNDTDLREPIRIVAQEAKLPITLLSPVSKPAERCNVCPPHRPILGQSPVSEPARRPGWATY